MIGFFIECGIIYIVWLVCDIVELYFFNQVLFFGLNLRDYIRIFSFGFF